MGDRYIISGPKFKFPVFKSSLGDFFFQNGKKHSSRICQIDGTIHKSETFDDVRIRSVRLALAMQKKGLTKNDIVTLCSANTLDNTIPIIAAFYLGANVTNVDSSFSVRQTKHLLSLVTPRMIFVEETAVDLIEKSLEDFDFKTEIIVFGSSDKYTTFSDLEKAQENENGFTPVDVDPDETGVMFFSSGTTGLPKAICHSHKTFLAMVQQSFETGCQGPFFHFTSFYWVTAMLIMSCAFETGTYRVFCRKPTPEEIFKIIEKYKVSFIFTAPVLTYPLTSFENAKLYDTSSVKLVICAGTPMAPSQLQKMNDLFPSASTNMGYALTEGGLVATFNLETDKELAKSKISLTPSGKTAPEVLLKVVDLDTNRTLGPKQKGEICVRSPSLMKGYHKIDSADVYDDEGFLKTGDVGYYDEDGCIYVVERLKEMFKYQSWHIVPSSIEQVLLEHPAIKEAAVFGVPRDEDGEVPAACIVLKEGSGVTEEEIHEFLAERVADREKLRGGVFFTDALLRTATGKLMRKEIRDFSLNFKKD